MPPGPLLAGRPPISGYGRGLFRIGGIEHRGSLLIRPDGVFNWPVTDAAALTQDMLAPVLSAAAVVPFLLLGTGAADRKSVV